MLANVNRLKDLMQREGFDAVIATCPENVTYLSGFWAMSQWVRRGPQEPDAMAAPFLERLRERPLLCDGAMGTALYSRGVPLDPR